MNIRMHFPYAENAKLYSRPLLNAHFAELQSAMSSRFEWIIFIGYWPYLIEIQCVPLPQ